MIYHCIRFTAKPGVTEDDKAAAIAQMSERSARIPAIRSSIVGRDFGGEYEFAAVSVIEDLAGYEEFMNHPAHLEMDRIGLPLVESFASYDITDDPDPEFGAKIAGIHQRRFDAMPDIADLVTDVGEYVGSAVPGKHAD
ncbi:MAG: Dabb family protein [Nocardioides sp.]|nr:Dabb family protein [Nocardioides sp.]